VGDHKGALSKIIHKVIEHGALWRRRGGNGVPAQATRQSRAAVRPRSPETNSSHRVAGRNRVFQSLVATATLAQGTKASRADETFYRLPLLLNVQLASDDHLRSYVKGFAAEEEGHSFVVVGKIVHEDGRFGAHH
jgi:hypothetical protein